MAPRTHQYIKIEHMKMKSYQVNGSLGLGISAVILGITALSSQAIANETVLTCTAGQYQTKVEYDSLSSNYTYIAYDKNASRNRPSLILKNGRMETGHTANSYMFKNGNYSYILAKRFEGRGGQAFLSISKSGKQIFHQQCQ
ncbi:hypothetical protein [Calothrix sp. PCC 7507]|uniref:hypothetical protein n=1 Tax=Calothrix sp. PCC 7507 TaxID=99598 RepID=UPI00029F29D4|nr:hypothetical protein [Calothrix sp. PCC 7507]AFY31174.1 hypothetical protein Cal7507_0685 [Calothrix sp. PCC 7507]